MLMLYASMDNYLKDGGKLGFVITQTVFKTKGAGDGFRRFRLGKEGPHLKVLSAHDLVELQPFEGASNRTATVILQKGEATEYPAGYTLWRKAKPGRIGMDLSLGEVEERTTRRLLSARPVNEAELTSPWLTASPAALAALQKVVGPSRYGARAGATTCGGDGVFLCRVQDVRPDGLVVVQNAAEAARGQLGTETAVLEPDVIYPVLRGKDVGRWRCASALYVVLPQDPSSRRGYDEHWLRVELPRTHEYLTRFKTALEKRQSKVLPRPPFYSVYGFGSYHLSPFKVVWGRVANRVEACVSRPRRDAPLGGKPVVPFEAMLCVTGTEDEAHYLCACLNCSASHLLVRAYIAGHPDTHVLDNVAIPKFEPSNPLHQSLASLSRRAHQLAASGKEGEAELRSVEEEIDRLAAQLWGITDEEMDEIRRALAELA
jgi:hypothetical protein